jgi:hypothetical protein
MDNIMALLNKTDNDAGEMEGSQGVLAQPLHAPEPPRTPMMSGVMPMPPSARVGDMWSSLSHNLFGGLSPLGLSPLVVQQTTLGASQLGLTPHSDVGGGLGSDADFPMQPQQDTKKFCQKLDFADLPGSACASASARAADAAASSRAAANAAACCASRSSANAPALSVRSSSSSSSSGAGAGGGAGSSGGAGGNSISTTNMPVYQGLITHDGTGSHYDLKDAFFDFDGPEPEGWSKCGVRKPFNDAAAAQFLSMVKVVKVTELKGRRGGTEGAQLDVKHFSVAPNNPPYNKQKRWSGRLMERKDRACKVEAEIQVHFPGQQPRSFTATFTSEKQRKLDASATPALQTKQQPLPATPAPPLPQQSQAATQVFDPKDVLVVAEGFLRTRESGTPKRADDTEFQETAATAKRLKTAATAALGGGSSGGGTAAAAAAVNVSCPTFRSLCVTQAAGRQFFVGEAELSQASSSAVQC